MNLSQQASGGRLTADTNPAYPFRCVVLECRDDGFWRVMSVFEMRTFADADMEGLDLCTEPFGAGVTAMHYYVGEIA